MNNIDFEKLISVQGIDSGTAQILGDYYIRGKNVDFRNSLFFVLIVLFVLFFLSFKSKF